MNELTVNNLPDAATMESLIIGGDLSKLTPAQRVSYYQAVCKSLGLNPLTKPFDYITLNGKLTLYAKKDATDQIRDNKSVSIVKLEKERLEDIYLVTAYATDKTGRQDVATGAVNIGNLRGDALANAFMKAETKAKRRVTLSICGLGMLDETEIETIPTAKPVIVMETGEIIEAQVQPVTEPTHASDPTNTAIFDIPVELTQYSGVCTEDGTPYPLLSLKDLTVRFNSLDAAIKANGLSDKDKAEKTRKRDAAKAVIEYKRSHPSA